MVLRMLRERGTGRAGEDGTTAGGRPQRGVREVDVGSLAWRVLGTGSAVLAAGFAQKGVTLLWRTATGTEPPTVPEDPDTKWGEAVAWALLSGAVIGLARLAATRRAAAYYRRSTGELPAALRRAS